VLTPLESRNVEICITKKTNPQRTNRDLAEEFGVSQSTVEKAIAWGKRRGVFVPESAKIAVHLQDHRKRLKEVDKVVKRLHKAHRQLAKEGNYTFIYKIARIEETRLRIARRIEELEGIQKEIEPAPQVNINVLNQQVSVFLKEKYPKAWEELREKLLNEYNRNGPG